MRGLLLIAIVLFAYNVNAITINEIMYNPEDSDNNKEYVEVILDDYLNLSGYKIEDLNSEDILEELKFVDNNFALIVEEGFNFTNINASYSAWSTINDNICSNFYFSSINYF